MENRKNDEFEIDLLHLAQVLAKNIIIIILVAVIFGGVFFGASKTLITPQYEAQAYMYVNSSNLSLAGAKVSISTGDLNAAKSLVETYTVILRTRMTLEEVIERAGLNYSYDTLRGMVEAASVNDTEVFSVTVTSPDPAEAELIANTIVQILPDKIASIVDGSSVRIVDYAVRPSAPKSPNNTSNAVIGAVLGAFLTCVVLIASDLMDEQIHDADYLSKTYNLPVLATIPDLLAKGDEYYFYRAEKRGQK